MKKLMIALAVLATLAAFMSKPIEKKAHARTDLGCIFDCQNQGFGPAYCRRICEY